MEGDRPTHGVAINQEISPAMEMGVSEPWFPTLRWALRGDGDYLMLPYGGKSLRCLKTVKDVLGEDYHSYWGRKPSEGGADGKVSMVPLFLLAWGCVTSCLASAVLLWRLILLLHYRRG